MRHFFPVLSALLLPLLFLTGAVAAAPVPTLTKGFTVYSDDATVARNPFPGGTGRVLPIWNAYRGPDGGYIACYSHDLAHAAYRVAPDIGVIGMVRLRGTYDGRIFQPLDYRDRDISALPRIQAICRRALKSCRGKSCWAGGDTGGFVGK
jgi:hypothetical protein